ncbi:helix-turn-helix domain-containing protein [Pediococcus acidilactici]
MKFCPLGCTIQIINGKWKSIILCRLMKKDLRYSGLLRSLSGCTRRMLSLQLSELIADRIIYKTVDPTFVPIKTTYHLTGLGHSLISVIKEMDTWGERYLDIMQDQTNSQSNSNDINIPVQPLKTN